VNSGEQLLKSFIVLVGEQLGMRDVPDDCVEVDKWESIDDCEMCCLDNCSRVGDEKGFVGYCSMVLVFKGASDVDLL
jgi:hypothetical protein